MQEVSSLLFEGSEKKLEVAVAPGKSLRDLGRDFWRQVVEASQAQILSVISNEECDAYLLSESSLFVWDQQFTMITCGRTTLVNAAMKFLDNVPADRLVSFIYERKNEYFPHLQPSDFFKDVKFLKERVPGRAFRFGHPDDHHLFLFHYEKSYVPDSSDCTLEILMYDLQGVAKDAFSSSNETLESVHQRTGVNRIFPGFQVDAFLFEPCGYSLNALRDSDYYTIHVTPQDIGPYVSFETNVDLGEDVLGKVGSVLEIFQPRSFDVVVFRPEKRRTSQVLKIPGYNVRARVQEVLGCGYEVSFDQFYKPNEALQKPMELKELLDV